MRAPGVDLVPRDDSCDALTGLGPFTHHAIEIERGVLTLTVRAQFGARLGTFEGREAINVALQRNLRGIGCIDGQVVDSVSYARSNPGVATQVDDVGNVCDAVHVYGDGDLGTPGLANPWCF